MSLLVKVLYFIEYQSLCSVVCIGSHHSLQPVCPPRVLGGRNIRLLEKGGRTQFKQVDRNASTLYSIIPLRSISQGVELSFSMILFYDYTEDLSLFAKLWTERYIFSSLWNGEELRQES
jgi:hypothetical protein